jgi:uncharacterized membrane protein YkvA (DUF1232 family)
MQIPPQLTRVWQMVVHAKGVFFSPTTPLSVKIVLAAGMLYALSHYDLIPEWVPVLGVMDDLALVALLIAWANRFSLPTNRK